MCNNETLAFYGSTYFLWFPGQRSTLFQCLPVFWTYGCGLYGRAGIKKKTEMIQVQLNFVIIKFGFMEHCKMFIG